MPSVAYFAMHSQQTWGLSSSGAENRHKPLLTARLARLSSGCAEA